MHVTSVRYHLQALQTGLLPDDVIAVQYYTKRDVYEIAEQFGIEVQEKDVNTILNNALLMSDGQIDRVYLEIAVENFGKRNKEVQEIENTIYINA